MSELNDLINKLCPDGVPYKKLGDIVDILDSRRKPVKRGSRVSGKYPYYGANGVQDYINDYLFDGEFLLVGEDGSVITDRGTPILNWASGKIWVNNHAHVLQEKADKQCMLRYIKYALECKNIAMLIHGAIPKLNQQTLKSIEIPVPPLPVQAEIVRILDAFTELETELEAELAGRIEQYEYYRDYLLDKKNLEAMDGKPVETMKLGEVAEIKRGERITKKDLIADGKYAVMSGGRDFFGRYNLYNRNENTITIAQYGSAGYVNYIKEKFWANDVCYCVFPLSCINNRYLYHVLKNNQDLLYKMTTKAIPDHLPKDRLINMEFPVPSLATQEHIVDILDRFDTLTTSLTDGIPAEIAMRREQYEYCRSRILDFPRLPDDTVSDDD